MKTLFSGIQPTGTPHLGNYFGMIAPLVGHQNSGLYEHCLVCVADLHSFTTEQTNLRSRSLQTAKYLYACGVSKSLLFIQSDVPEHTQLYFLLSCLTQLGELERMTQFKSKKENQKRENLGLLSYPVLMASDVLLYNTDFVPVGEDQTQHLELVSTLAKRVNKKYGEVFTVPQPLLSSTSKVYSLTSPTEKMSKSSKNKNGVIFLSDSASDTARKVRKAVTTDEGIENLKQIAKELQIPTENLSNSQLKENLTDKLIVLISEIRQKAESLSDEEIEEVLEVNTRVVRALAKKNYNDFIAKLG